MSNIETNRDWMELMGDKLILKKIGPQPSKEQQQYAEIGDAIYIDYVARTLPLSSPPDNNNIDLTLYDFPIHDYIKMNNDENNKINPPDIFVHKQQCLVTLGDGDVVPILEMALRFIPLNESGIVRSDARFGYGPKGYQSTSNHQHPSNTCVEVFVTIKSIISSENNKFTSAEFVIERGLAKKQLGNEALNNEHNPYRALNLYQSSVQLLQSYLESLNDTPPSTNKAEIIQQSTHIIIDCLNNASLVHYQTKNYSKAKELATQVLASYDIQNVRALYRAAKASMMDPGGSYEESKAAIDAATDILGKDHTDVKRLFHEWKRKKLETRRREKALFSKMVTNSQSTAKLEFENMDSREERENQIKDNEGILSMSTEEQDQVYNLETKDDVASKSDFKVKAERISNIISLVVAVIIAYVLQTNANS